MKEGRTRNITTLTVLTLLSVSFLAVWSRFSTPERSMVSASPGTNQNLTPQEEQVVAKVNGTRAYGYDLEVERLGLNHTLSNYSFRAAGSSGANQTAKYITKKFQSFGLETYNESFEFTNWELLTEPTLTIDDDGDPATTGDQVRIDSFQSTHYSWPTPEGGLFRDLVVLPLPPAANIDEVGLNPIDTATWNSINTTGKILLTGREVTWPGTWHLAYRNKLSAQPPAAVVLTWWYDWESFSPMMYWSADGRPAGRWGPYYWNLHIPVGGVDYSEGLWIRNRETSLNVSASFKIESVIGSGPHYNVIGRLNGYLEPQKYVIVSGHYDTVTTAGFGDNGAGTAGVIESAKVITDAVKTGLYRPKYSILFIAFASEEIGLVGSIYYIKQHKAQMTDIVAVINLDCIGSDDFYVSETSPSSAGLDLDQLVLQAAADLGVNAALTQPGGSDQESFRDPVWANSLLQYYWGIDPSIADAVPVQPSALLISEPLLYSDKWSTGTPGWIHTSYDNSTSTQTLNWIEIDKLENHIKIGALSILRVSPTTIHDIAVTDITHSKNIVGQGYSVRIDVTVKNLGDYTESFNLTAYANAIAIEKRNTSLASKTQATLTFTWDTNGFAKGNWTISAYAWPLPNEADINNNTHIDGEVTVVTPGDVNADGIVNVVDAGGISAHWHPGPPTGPLGYASNFDIDSDGNINVVDAGIVSAYWTGPPKGPSAP